MKIEINYMKETGKLTNMWRLNNILLNNQRVKKNQKRILKILETNGNEAYQNLWDSQKRLMAINAYSKVKKNLK